VPATMLTERHIDADNRLAKFVTVKAYEDAAGPVVRDLFSDDDQGWLMVLERHVSDNICVVYYKGVACFITLLPHQ
jgi:ParB family transcriptional regulator, chromosome partitioning protein